MGQKEIISYLFILLMSFIFNSKNIFTKSYYIILPIAMIILPIIRGYKIKIRFVLSDILRGLIISLIILMPFYIIFSKRDISNIGYIYFIYQLFIVAMPEEVFFRGYLQDSVGRNYKAIIIVSILFSIAHLPRALFFNEWTSLLAFFPSLIMGWLFMKTNNVLPSIIFHWLANIIYRSIVSISPALFIKFMSN